MPKYNVFALSAPDSPSETRSFEEDGVTIDITFRRMNMPDTLAAKESANDVIRTHMGIDPDTDELTGEPPIPFPSPIDITLSETLLTYACMIEAAQCCPDEDKYGWREIVQLSATRPKIFADILKFFGEMQAAEKKSLTPD